MGPECPPITVMFSSAGSVPLCWEMKRLARTTSRVVTPKSRLGLKTPFDLKISAQIGTVELTGLEMTRMLASGAASAQAFARSRTIEALVLNRSIDD